MAFHAAHISGLEVALNVPGHQDICTVRSKREGAPQRPNTYPASLQWGYSLPTH